MSTSPDTPESEFDLDLHFLPAWAQQPANKNLYAGFEGEREQRGERRGRPGERPGRRPEGARPRPPGGPGGFRRPEGRGGPRRDDRREDRGPRPRREEAPRPAVPLPEVQVAFLPDEKGVESLVRQIRMTGRAYPLFQIAQLVLQKPERHLINFSTIKKPDGQVAQPLVVCAVDDTVWLSEAEAVNHILSRHFNLFYQAEKTPIDPPKGTYTFVAQCGMSGVVLGPPNYHDYQNRLRKLHAERYSRMPFEAYKARVRIVRDEATVKQWLEEQSWRTEYVALNIPETVRLTSRDQVEAHFRQTHLPNLVKQVDEYTVPGTITRKSPSSPLMRLVRQRWEEQRHFPLQIAAVLSQQFAARGLQFFKVNRTVTHVAVARPHYLDLEVTPVSEGIKRIIHFIDAHPRCTRRQLLEALAPGSTPKPSAAPAAPPAQTSETPAAESQEPKPEAAATPAPAPEPSPEATAVISDLHWLIHQGHVIEFATGLLETAKKPIPRPPKPPKAPSATEPAAPTTTAESETVASTEAVEAPSSSDLDAEKQALDASAPPPPVASPDPVSDEQEASPAESAPDSLPPAGEPETPPRPVTD